MDVDFYKYKILHFTDLDSTNSYAKSYAKENQLVDPIIISTDYQTHGKGQMNNIWQSERSKNLLMSLIIKLPLLIQGQFNLNIMISLSIIDLLKDMNLTNLSIKWPNDILVYNHKIAGILIENKVYNDLLKYSVIGIGVNVNQKYFPSFDRPATSIMNETSKLENIHEVKLSLISKIQIRYFNYIKDPESQLNEYLEYLYLRGKMSNFIINKSMVRGIIKSVDREGKIIIDICGVNESFYLNQIKFID